MNRPGDAYEQEADRVADQVERMGDLHGALQAAVPDALLAGGQMLEPSARRFMEAQFGHDFSRVRVYGGEQAAASARALDARAYTVGERIVLGRGESVSGRSGRSLLAHELTHVVQQRGGGTGPNAEQLSSSGVRVARQSPSQGARGKVVGKPVVVHERASDRPHTTRVTMTVVGHASPRWKGARSHGQADARNVELSHRRERVVRDRVQQYLRDALPDQQLAFQYATSPDAGADLFDDRATIDIASSAVGSQQTLKEAGNAGRAADDPTMRRVDVSISLSSAIDTALESTIKESREVSGATRDWAIKMGVGLQVEEGVGGGGFSFQLKNRKTGREVDGTGEFGSAGAGVNLPIPTIDMGGYEDFTTGAAVNFSDFDYARFTIGSAGFNALLFGYEWSELALLGLPGGVVHIDVGGAAMGGAGLDLGTAKLGMMWLEETPDTYQATTFRDEVTQFTSESSEGKQHRVLFKTGEAVVSSEQDLELLRFVAAAVENYQRAEPWHEP